MAEVIDVNFNGLTNAADTLSANARVVTSNMEQLVSSLAPLKATWYASGSSAGQACDETERRLAAAIADIVTTINTFSAKTHGARDMQVALENQNANMFNVA
jgi:uncharacterized protein YukE